MIAVLRRALGYIYTMFRSCGYSMSSSHLNPARSGISPNEAKHVASYMVVGCKDRFVLWVLLNTAQSKSVSSESKSEGINSTKRHRGKTTRKLTLNS